jgi:hypothetical protein
MAGKDSVACSTQMSDEVISGTLDQEEVLVDVPRQPV